MPREMSETAVLLWRIWGFLSYPAMIGVMLWIDRDKNKPPTEPHTELPSYDDQLAALFHDDQP